MKNTSFLGDIACRFAFSLVGLVGLGLAAVTSENSQLQALIQQIDEVLDKTNPRLPWVTSSDAIQQRQVLEQTRSYLRSLQQEAAKPDAPDETEGETEGETESDGSDLGDSLDVSEDVSDLSVLSDLSDLNEWVDESEDSSYNSELSGAPLPLQMREDDNPATEDATTPATNPAEMQAQQVLQAVLQEMSYLRANLLQPMRSDVEALRLQREVLTQEIQQLEQQRQQYGWSSPNSPHLHEFLQAAMAQMQENLTGQMAQMLATLSSSPSNPLQLESTSALLSPVERLEQLQRIQAQSDQLMSRLDTTLRLVFESLQNQLHSYGDSLEEGLNRMHDVGQQGEAVFGAFVTRLAQLLGREASAFLQAPVSDREWSNDRPSLPGPGNMAAPESLGTENSLHADAQINQLLEGLQALDPSASNATTFGEPIPFAGEAVSDQADSSIDRAANLDLEIEALDRTLSQIDLSAISSVETFETQENSLLSREQLGFLPSLGDEVDPFSDQKSDAATNETEPGANLENDLENDLKTDLEIDRASDVALGLLNQVTPEPDSSLRIDEHSDRTEQPNVVTPLDADFDANIFNEFSHLPATPDPPTDRHNEQVNSLSESIANQWPIAPDPAFLNVPQTAEHWLLRSSQTVSPEPLPLSTQADHEDESGENEDEGEDLDPEPPAVEHTDQLNDQLNEHSDEHLNEHLGEPEDLGETDIETISLLTDLIRLDNEGNLATATITQTIADVDASWTVTNWQTFQGDDASIDRSIDQVEQTAADVLLESTIEDLFAAIEAEPIDQTSERLQLPNLHTQAYSQNQLQSYSQVSSSDTLQTTADAVEFLMNAFTLEGLDSLFEGIPSMDSATDDFSDDSIQENEAIRTGFAEGEAETEAIDRLEQMNLDHPSRLESSEPKLGTLADLTRDLLQDRDQ
jgi:hypothetical protein